MIPDRTQSLTPSTTPAISDGTLSHIFTNSLSLSSTGAALVSPTKTSSPTMSLPTSRSLSESGTEAPAKTLTVSTTPFSSVPFSSEVTMAYVYFPPSAGQATTTHFANSVWRGGAVQENAGSFAIVSDLPAAVLVEAATAVPRYVQLMTSSNNSHRIRISNATHDAIGCVFGDEESFTAILIPINASLTAHVGSRQSAPVSDSGALAYTSHSCYMYDTVDEMHLACAKAGPAQCAGFSTIRIDAPSPTEMPHCLHTAAALLSSNGTAAAAVADSGASQSATGRRCGSSSIWEASGVSKVAITAPLLV